MEDMYKGHLWYVREKGRETELERDRLGIHSRSKIKTQEI